MKKTLVIFAILLVTMSFVVQAKDLSDYPKIFDQEIQLVSNQKHNLSPVTILGASSVLMGHYDLKKSNKMDKDVTDFSTDFVLAGGPCENSVTAKFVDPSDCKMGTQPGQGIIKLIEKDGSTVLIIAGYTHKEELEASNYLRDNAYKLEGTEIFVGEPTAAPAPEPVVEPAPAPAPEPVAVEPTPAPEPVVEPEEGGIFSNLWEWFKGLFN